MKTNLIFLAIMSVMIGLTTCKPKEERAPVIPMENFFKDPEKAGFVAWEKARIELEKMDEKK